ncbi:MAG: hypothetical protein R6V85_03875 [Polyangia bacterium]
MLPGSYEFLYEPHHLIFLGCFACAIAVIAGCFAVALLRTARRLARTGETTAVRKVAGLALPAGRSYYRNHTWTRRRENGSLELGLDDLARRLLGETARLHLPSLESTLVAGEPLLEVEIGARCFSLRSPVSGRVIDRGQRSDGGYLLVIEPSQEGPAREGVPENQLAGFFSRELDRLHALLSPGSAAPALADGGALANDLPGAAPTAPWNRIHDALLAEPQP